MLLMAVTLLCAGGCSTPPPPREEVWVPLPVARVAPATREDLLEWERQGTGRMMLEIRLRDIYIRALERDGLWLRYE